MIKMSFGQLTKREYLIFLFLYRLIVNSKFYTINVEKIDT